MPTCAGSLSLLQPKWRGQSRSGVLASSAVLAPVGKGPKMGRLTSAPYCRVKWRCVHLPRGHPRPGPQNLRAYCQLSRADLKPNPKGFDSNQLPEERAGGPSCTCVTDTIFVSQSRRRRVEAPCSDKSSCWSGQDVEDGPRACAGASTRLPPVSGTGMKATHLNPQLCQVTEASGHIPTACKSGAKITSK